MAPLLGSCGPPSTSTPLQQTATGVNRLRGLSQPSLRLGYNRHHALGAASVTPTSAAAASSAKPVHLHRLQRHICYAENQPQRGTQQTDGSEPSKKEGASTNGASDSGSGRQQTGPEGPVSQDNAAARFFSRIFNNPSLQAPMRILFNALMLYGLMKLWPTGGRSDGQVRCCKYPSGRQPTRVVLRAQGLCDSQAPWP